jgi:peptidoglycan/LPS O-acetylase OafA/YrhL
MASMIAPMSTPSPSAAGAAPVATAAPAPSGHGTERPEGFYIPSLDGLRAFAVMVVFVAHAGLNLPVPGNFGVTIFFFLSGYLITTLARMECERTGSLSLSRFYLRRVLRILPPFYLVLAGASLLCAVGLLEGGLGLDAVLAQVLHLSNYYIVADGWWTGRAPGTWVFWSLAVEEHFYLIFPALYIVLWQRVKSSRKQLLILGTMCLAVLAWRCILVFGLDAARDRTYVASDTRIDSILFGCILAVFGNPMLDPTRIPRRVWQYVLLPLGLAGLLVSFALRNQEFQETFRYTLQGLSLFPIFVVAVRYPTWSLFRLLNIGWVRFLGVLSYSFYLVHPTVLFGVHQWTPWPAPVQGLLSLAVSLALAAAIYHLVEKPAARLRRRLTSRRAAKPDVAGAGVAGAEQVAPALA